MRCGAARDEPPATDGINSNFLVQFIVRLFFVSVLSGAAADLWALDYRLNRTLLTSFFNIEFILSSEHVGSRLTALSAGGGPYWMP